jgi:predicted Fe-S protein YdhL (DUF1289 family)
MAAISSPCTKVCRVDVLSGICVGCGRSLDEIGHWLSLSEPERRRIMAELPARLRRVGAGPIADATTA